PLPEPLQLNTLQVNNPRWEGTLIKTDGVVLDKYAAGGGTTLEISDGKGRTSVRIWDTAELDLSDININNRIFVEGVGGVFISRGDSIYQLLTVYQDQIEIDENYSPDLANVSLKVDPRPFVPDRGETIGIDYNVSAVGNWFTLRIFDLGGRLIHTLRDENAEIIQNRLEWDGRDQYLDLVPLGTYICHLEVLEQQSGNRKTAIAPIVVGTILSK
ncbi:MAG: hypothetical protein WAN36_08750, partial [Calditrichia bacterium]